MTSDASGSWGCGGWSGSNWFQLQWPGAAEAYHISFKELFAWLISAAIWGGRWKGSRVRWLCDNQPAVHAVLKRSCRDQGMMHLVRCLFFLEAWFGFELVAEHLPGRENVLVDDLSCHHLPSFLSKALSADPASTSIPAELPELLMDQDGWTSPSCTRLAELMQRTYRSGLNRYLSICFTFRVQPPFPVSETLLCYFVTSLAGEGCAPAAIKIYLAAVRHAQIMRGHPEPRETSFLPCLRLLQNGVRSERAESANAPLHCLPITIPILRLLRLLPGSQSYDGCLRWTATTVCFFVFFRPAEIMVPNTSAFNLTVHLAWGNVAISEDGRSVRVLLKRSKMDQFMQGVEGVTGNNLCPVNATQEYVARWGATSGAFFRSSDRTPLSKPLFVEMVHAALSRAGVPVGGYSGHSFRIGAATAASQARIPDSVIQALGRWSSSAFLRYIRTSREQLALLSSSMATQQMNSNVCVCCVLFAISWMSKARWLGIAAVICYYVRRVGVLGVCVRSRSLTLLGQGWSLLGDCCTSRGEVPCHAQPSPFAKHS